MQILTMRCLQNLMTAGVNDRAKSLAEVINLISDDESLLIFKTIFSASGE